MINKKRGFTLAEVLITLGIIGVVASMTIPTLIQNHRKAELRTGLNAAYSIISQATAKMAQEENQSLFYAYAGTENSFKPEFMKYFKTIKDCNKIDCNSADKYANFANNNTNSAYASFLSNGQFVLANGMTIFISNGGVADDSQMNSSNYGIFISVDVNGHEKNPNRWGYDLFTFELMKNNTVKPVGAPGGHPNWGDSKYCGKYGNFTNNGMSCAARALSEDEFWDELD